MEQTTSRAGVDPRVLKHIRTTARRLTGDKAIPGMDAQDIEQDLVLDLWRRRAAFDPSRATFRTFADRVVAHRVATLTGPTVRLAAERATLSLDLPAANDDGDATLADILSDPDEPADLDEQHGLRLDVRRFVAGLTPALKRCCAILLAPNVTEAAAAAGLHRSSVYESAQRLRRLAAAAGLQDYVGGPRHIAQPAGR
jgi:DNA-directed RNA polymerase specialized sigma24 family protein